MSDSIEKIVAEMRRASVSSAPDELATFDKLNEWADRLASLRQVPEVLVKANDEIGNCPLRSPARSIAIRQFQALAGEYVRSLIDEANPVTPTSDPFVKTTFQAVAEPLYRDLEATQAAQTSGEEGPFPEPGPSAYEDEPTPAQAGALTIVGWMYEDELPERYPYDEMFPHSKVDIVRMFPVYAPAEAQAGAELPELPEPAKRIRHWDGECLMEYFAADQMREMYRRGLKDGAA